MNKRPKPSILVKAALFSPRWVSFRGGIVVKQRRKKPGIHRRVAGSRQRDHRSAIGIFLGLAPRQCWSCAVRQPKSSQQHLRFVDALSAELHDVIVSTFDSSQETVGKGTHRANLKPAFPHKHSFNRSATETATGEASPNYGGMTFRRTFSRLDESCSSVVNYSGSIPRLLRLLDCAMIVLWEQNIY
jgi:hypothetical protein